MRTIILICVLCFGVLSAPRTARAQDPMPTSDEKGPLPELVRSVPNELIGELLLPFDWTDSVLPDGVNIVSSSDDNGELLSIQLALVPSLPEGANLERYVDALVAETRASAKDVRPLMQEPFTHGEIKGVRAELLLEEEGFLMHYLLLAMPWRKGTLIVTLGAPITRYDASNSDALVFAILDAIK